MSTIDEIRERWSKAMRGPWRWFGNTKMHDIYLATTHSGRRYVMQFERYGMRGAQPRFQVKTEAGGIMTKASELVTYEVRPAPGEEPYRHDVDGIDHPDAIAIASAPEDVRVLLEEIDRLRAARDDYMQELIRTYREIGNDVAASSIESRLRALGGRP